MERSALPHRLGGDGDAKSDLDPWDVIEPSYSITDLLMLLFTMVENTDLLNLH